MAEEPVEAPVLLPADTLILSPDDDLELSAVIDGDIEIEAVEPQVRPWGKSWSWDDNTNRFARFGGAPAPTHGDETLINWCRNAVTMARLAHPIFSDDFGMENPWLLIGVPLTTGLKAEHARMVQEALLIEPRITDVTDFVYTAEAEIVYVSFDIVTDNSETLGIEKVALNG